MSVSMAEAVEGEALTLTPLGGLAEFPSLEPLDFLLVSLEPLDFLLISLEPLDFLLLSLGLLDFLLTSVFDLFPVKQDKKCLNFKFLI